MGMAIDEHVMVDDAATDAELRAAGFVVERDDTTLWGSAYAVFDETRRYRYALGRCWGPGAWRAYLMLNPSTADAFKVDPTVSRCLKRAATAGFGGVLILNLFALRSPHPRDLLGVDDPVGPDNNDFIVGMGEHVWHEVIVGWGSGGSGALRRLVRARATAVGTLLDGYDWTLAALQTNTDGSPKHPLYCRTEDTPTPWSPPDA